MKLTVKEITDHYPVHTVFTANKFVVVQLENGIRIKIRNF